MDIISYLSMDTINYVLLAMIILGITVFLAGSLASLPFFKERLKRSWKTLTLPISMIILGLALLMPLAYPYIVYILPISHSAQPLPQSVTDGLMMGEGGKAQKSGKGLEGAVIHIPSVKVEAPVIESVDKDAIQTAVGHVPWSKVPWENGNVVILGENFMHQFKGPSMLFSTLHLTKKDAEINIYSKDKVYKYIVSGTKVIEPSALNGVAADTDDKRLTLVTCYPPGTQNKRFIVTASFDSVEKIVPIRS